MRPFARFGLFACVLFLVGCGGNDSTRPSGAINDDVRINSLVTEFTDVSSTQSFTKYFAAGTKLTLVDLKKYQSFSYTLDGKPAINGTSASAKVKIANVNDNKEVGNQQWNFVKEGDQWKIKDAPLQ